mgnify:CR=1 FL=1
MRDRLWVCDMAVGVDVKRRTMRRRGGMTKEGSALLRKMLYMAALQSVKRTTNAFHPLYASFVARGKAKMCALGAIMHKLIRIAFGVLKHQTKFAPNLARMGLNNQKKSALAQDHIYNL